MDYEDARQEMKRHSQTATSQESSATCSPSKLTFKAYFFLFFAAIGSLGPWYLTLYFKQLGLTAGHAGILNGVRLFTEFIGSPLWGMVGDKFRIRKIILLASLVSYTTGTLLLMAVQPQNQQCIKTEANKTEIASLIFTAGGTLKLQDDKQGERFESNPADLTRKVDESEITRIFIIFLVIICTSQIIGSVVFTMPDALVVGFLKENVNAFGSFRMWGEVGVAGGSFLVGGVINFYQSEVCGETVKNFFISFYFFAGFNALAIVTVFFVKVSYADPETSSKVTLLPLVKELLKFRNAVIIIVATYLGMLDGLHESFGFWYLDDLGAKPYMLGIASGLRYTIALLAYFSSELVISKFGHMCAISASLALYVAVYLALAFVLNPWLGVILYSAQGLLYGTSWVACVVFGGTISLQHGFYAVTQGKRLLGILILPTDCRIFLFKVPCNY